MKVSSLRTDCRQSHAFKAVHYVNTSLCLWKARDSKISMTVVVAEILNQCNIDLLRNMPRDIRLTQDTMGHIVEPVRERYVG